MPDDAPSHIPLPLKAAQIQGDDPASAAWDSVLGIGKGLPHARFIERVRALPAHWRAVYTLYWLECEVNNGGYHQFFFNTEGTLNAETLDDLRAFAPGPFVLLFEEALDVFAAHDYAAERERAATEGWEAFTEGYREGRMQLLDEAFYKVDKPLSEHLSDQIRTHASLYGKPFARTRRPPIPPEAQELFERYRGWETAFDTALVDLYADDARILNARAFPGDAVRLLSMPAPAYKQLLRQALPVARERGDINRYSDLAFSIEGSGEGEGVRITATRFSELKQYTSGLTLRVAPDTTGTWLIREEWSESRAG